jgi:hypothetical protein
MNKGNEPGSNGMKKKHVEIDRDVKTYTVYNSIHSSLLLGENPEITVSY